jgi:A/G-specific adenine glycosylase
MELGATVCTPRAPRCDGCPIRRHCRALALGRPEAFPPAGERRAPARLRRAIALVEAGGRTLVVRREGALLAGLWEPPGVELARGLEAGPPLASVLEGLGVAARPIDTGERVKHVITHRTITVEIWRVELAGKPPRKSALVRWVRPGDHHLALTALAQRVITGRRATD